MSGRVELILGPMFSGKTTELMRRMRRYQLGGKNCLIIKYDKDTRYDSKCVCTHDGKIQSECIIKSDLTDISIDSYDAIFIDEIQFFFDAPKILNSWANTGIHVHVCGLNGTYRQTPFPVISNLLPLCENILFLTAICKDTGNEASFTYKHTLTTEYEPIEQIGGGEIYAAIDRQTLNNNT